MNIPKKYLDIAEKLTILLDSKFTIFGFKFGIDPLLDLIPGIGNILGACVSGYILFLGIYFRVPSNVIIKMFLNILLDYLLGILPFIGFISDIVFKANIRNVELLKKHTDETVLTGQLIE